jgi:hypothetical protein
MSVSKADHRTPARSQRPKATTVFAAAFLAGAAAAVGLNRTLDVHLAQRQPRVESEPIFVALRSLPPGAPVTVWDVALRDWPKAMLPAAAMRPRDTFAGMVLKHPLREGQPILSVQLVKAVTAESEQVAHADVDPVRPIEPAAPQTDLWAPADVAAPVTAPAEAVSTRESFDVEPPAADLAETQPLPTESIVAESPAPVTALTEAEHDVGDAEALAEPVVAEPVIVATPAATDIDPVGTPVVTAAESEPAPTREPTMRYLVVPERIALEADRSFVPSPEDPPAGAVPETTAAASPKQSSVAPVQTGRLPRPTDRTSSSRDRQPQRPPRSAASHAAPAKPAEKTSLLRSMIPNLSLGMGAAEPTPASEAPAQGKSDQATRPAFRGFGLFR